MLALSRTRPLIALFYKFNSNLSVTQQTNTCSSSIIETLEKGLNMIEVNNKDNGTTSHLFLVFLLLTLNW